MADALPPDLDDLPPAHDPHALPHDGWAQVEVLAGGTYYGRVADVEHFEERFCRIDYRCPDGWRSVLVPGCRLHEVRFMPEAAVRKLSRGANRAARRQDAKTEFETD